MGRGNKEILDSEIGGEVYMHLTPRREGLISLNIYPSLKSNHHLHGKVSTSSAVEGDGVGVVGFATRWVVMEYVRSPKPMSRCCWLDACCC